MLEKSSERENIAVFPQNTMLQQQTQHNENVTSDNDQQSTFQSSSQSTLQSVTHNDFHSTPCMSISDSDSCSTSHTNYHSDLHIDSLSTPHSDSHRTLHCDSPTSFVGFKSKLHLRYGMLFNLFLVIFIRMMKDLVINLEDFNVLVMHYA